MTKYIYESVYCKTDDGVNVYKRMLALKAVKYQNYELFKQGSGILCWTLCYLRQQRY